MGFFVGNFGVFCSVKGMPFNCTSILLYCKMQYICWKELMLYVSMVVATTDGINTKIHFCLNRCLQTALNIFIFR